MPVERVWTDPETGYLCVVKIQAQGTRCGYVGVPRESQFYGRLSREPALDFVSVHGSITYSEFVLAGVPAQGPPLFWLGFDCNHPGDSPDVDLADPVFKGVYERSPFLLGGHVWGLEEVVEECRRFAYQLYYVEDLPEALVEASAPVEAPAPPEAKGIRECRRNLLF